MPRNPYTLTISAATLFASSACFAQTPDYVIDGIYAGMPADQAKTAGFNICEPSDDYFGGVICRRKQTVKTVFSIPVVNVVAVFEKPYAVVQEVQVTFES